MNRQIYAIVTGHSDTILENVVNLYLADGYKLQGGISVTFMPFVRDEGGILYFSQALVKNKGDDENEQTK